MSSVDDRLDDSVYGFYYEGFLFRETHTVGPAIEAVKDGLPLNNSVDETYALPAITEDDEERPGVAYLRRETSFAYVDIPLGPVDAYERASLRIRTTAIFVATVVGDVVHARVITENHLKVFDTPPGNEPKEVLSLPGLPVVTVHPPYSPLTQELPPPYEQQLIDPTLPPLELLTLREAYWEQPHRLSWLKIAANARRQRG